MRHGEEKEGEDKVLMDAGGGLKGQGVKVHTYSRQASQRPRPARGGRPTHRRFLGQSTGSLAPALWRFTM